MYAHTHTHTHTNREGVGSQNKTSSNAIVEAHNVDACKHNKCIYYQGQSDEAYGEQRDGAEDQKHGAATQHDEPQETQDDSQDAKSHHNRPRDLQLVRVTRFASVLMCA
jgi:hypothetical protein